MAWDRLAGAQSRWAWGISRHSYEFSVAVKPWARNIRKNHRKGKSPYIPSWKRERTWQCFRIWIILRKLPDNNIKGRFSIIVQLQKLWDRSVAEVKRMRIPVALKVKCKLSLSRYIGDKENIWLRSASGPVSLRPLPDLTYRLAIPSSLNRPRCRKATGTQRPNFLVICWTCIPWQNT